VSAKEATARIKINKLLEAAGWRFFPEGTLPANIRLESNATTKTADLDAFGDNFEKTANGFIDFLLLDAKGFPLIVLEAKSEDKNTLVGKEQARKYAKAQNCRFVILSNGNLHYFWDLERGKQRRIRAEANRQRRKAAKEQHAVKQPGRRAARTTSSFSASSSDKWGYHIPIYGGHHRIHWIVTRCATNLNSGSPVTSTAECSMAQAREKQSA
jgi:type I site-specific restriction endonuclease